ncbi:RNA-directed DNA polymerase [Frigoribacterium endophyticum]|uniref:RNA-directed DNA polymerase n=1 Tax=Frigoribacterium endophyticum TaxID=1522176 RepID=UPI0014227774|nr:hypothetical protein [Frigoribacterium endophyticum]
MRSELAALLDVKKRYETDLFESMRDQLELRVLHPPKSIRLRRGLVKGRNVITFNKSRPSLMLFDRFVALHLKRAFRINTGGRDQALRVVRNSLLMSSRAQSVRQGLIRLDIEKFYESIDHDVLRKKVTGHAGVPRFVKEHTKQVLEAYERLTGLTRGLPDGVPSSASLAEIYLERFDFAVRHHPDVALFVRYADDMIVVCEPERIESLNKHIDTLLRRENLRRNLTKSTSLLHPQAASTALEFLGYKFIFASGSSRLLAIDISDSKVARYEEGLRRLKEYADNIACWTNVNAVDRYIALDSYLFHPHATADAGHGVRIVTGLAYSARFVMGPLPKRTNFERLMAAYRAELGARWGGKIAGLKQGIPITCACCGNSIHRAEVIAAMGVQRATEHNIMRAKAGAHLDDEIHDWARSTLWD